MKPIAFILVLCMAACQPDHSSSALAKKVDSLRQQLAHTYKPGFGEFMTGIQEHHAKLWLAGQAGNWGLADFEIHEIMESVEAIQTVETARKETKYIPMLLPALDSVNHAITRKNKDQFRSGFIFLTQTCNNCHQVTDFSFNKVVVPDKNPFPNQAF
ncbi:MAG TPA: hypothetical protein VG842_00295 [Sediminibacterium sp.]|nr:hypothetical protein [Sediminibacterium sp.]